MDHGLRAHDEHGSLSGMAPTSGRGNKRSRENETPSQRTKREKAAERQRRKRERDREAASAAAAAAAAGMMSYPPPTMMEVQQQQVQPPPQAHHPQAIMHAQPVQEYATPTAPPMHHQPPPPPEEQPISAEDEARKERVRAAARERQRKHRALVKARKMRELGLDMGNEVLGGVEEPQYRVEQEGVYQPPVMLAAHEHGPPPGVPGHPGSSPPQAQHEPPFPQGQPLGGQTFASTLLLSFSCAPLLKQHLLRTLSMTNEELASLEPVIAAAWDQWDYNRRIHAQAQQGEHPVYPGPDHPASNEFRARFHRSLVAPTPFGPGAPPTAPEIDPSLTASPAAAASGHSGEPGDGEGGHEEEEET